MDTVSLTVHTIPHDALESVEAFEAWLGSTPPDEHIELAVNLDNPIQLDIYNICKHGNEEGAGCGCWSGWRQFFTPGGQLLLEREEGDMVAALDLMGEYLTSCDPHWLVDAAYMENLVGPIRRRHWHQVCYKFMT